MTIKKLASSFVYPSFGLIIFAIDRLTKYWALHNVGQQPRIINNWLSFELCYNRGISWSFFDSENDIIFFLLTALIIAVTVAVGWYGYERFAHKKSAIGQLFIVAGSLSNIVDRFAYCGVIDFIAIHWQQYYFPIFNIADMAIVGGVAILLLQVLHD